MTFVAAIRYQSQVCVIADSAITSTPRPGQIALANTDELTTFGQQELHDASIQVRESAIKIRRYGNVAMAFSGEVALSREFMDLVARDAQEDGDWAAAFRRMACSYSPPPPFAVLAALWNPSECTARLLVFNAEQCGTVRDLPTDSVVMLGSPTELHKRLLLRMSEVSRELAPDWRLPCLTVMANLMGVQHDLMSRGIGGAFCGCSVQESGLTWHPDLTYLLFDERGEHHDLVHSYIRDNNHIVYSTIRKGFLVLMDGPLTCSFDSWRDQFVRPPGLDGTWPRFVAMLHTTRPCVALIELDDEGRHPELSLSSEPAVVGTSIRVRIDPKLVESWLAAGSYSGSELVVGFVWSTRGSNAVHCGKLTADITAPPDRVVFLPHPRL